jgi:acyl transferase domain-containing protein/NADPH:quinone reductase-like Zn-dependent oxidoreductase/NADP-dependent 3-hydroxy acid dehydrogenase YdfG
VFKHKTGIRTAVGGLKPNIGHSEGNSALASIIKVALALEHNEIPATIGINKVNPSIKLDEWNLDIVTENRRWPKSRVRRGSVNSFGFGGANGHAILEAKPTGYDSLATGFAVNGNDSSSNNNNDVILNRLASGPINETTDRGSHEMNNTAIYGESNRATSGTTYGVSNGVSAAHPALLTFSARTEYSLDGIIKNFSTYLAEFENQVNLCDLTYTLNGRRTRLATRAFMIVTSETFAQDVGAKKLISKSPGNEALPFAFVFTGQGAQWPRMGSQLLDQYSVFRESIRHLDSCLLSLSEEDRPSWTLEDTITAPAESSEIDLAEKSQPICTAVQIALVDLLKGWGIAPTLATGHSSGEIAAAYSAGYLSAHQGIMAAYFRGRAVAKSTRHGAMMAVDLYNKASRALVAEHNLTDRISLACDNSPESTTLSGDADAVEYLVNVQKGKQRFARVLKTNGKAYHSQHMKDIGSLYQQSLDRIWNAEQPADGQKSNANVHVISSVTGRKVTAREMATTSYWRANLESPVKFHDAVKEVFKLGQYHFIELGPHSALELPIKQIAASIFENRTTRHHAYDSALIRGKDAGLTLLSLIGSLFLHSHDEVPFENVLADDLAMGSRYRRVLTDLPRYVWDYTAPVLWTEPRAVTEFRNRTYPRHDLLGSQVPGASKLTTTWRNIIDVNEVSWLKDHRLGPSIVFPAAAYLAMGAEAACQVSGVQLRDCRGVELRNFNFLKAMDFHAEQRPRIEVITEVRKAHITNVVSSESWWELTVSSILREDSQPTVHATGLVSHAQAEKTLTRTINLDKDSMEQQANRVWYDKFRKEGLNWGPKFAVMEAIYCDRARRADISLATTRLIRGEQKLSDQSWQYIAHPISIDSMLQAAFVATTGGWVRKLRATVPVKIDKVTISTPSLLDMDISKQWAIDTKSKRVGFCTVNIEAELYNSSGETLVRLEGGRCIAYQGNVQQEPPEQRNPLCRVAWIPDIDLMDTGANPGLTVYIDKFVRSFSTQKAVPERLLRLAGALDICAYKYPNAKILLLDVGQTEVEVVLQVLRAGSVLRRFESCTLATLANGELRGREAAFTVTCTETTDSIIPKETKFDIIISLGKLFLESYSWMAALTMVITMEQIDRKAFPTSDVKAIAGKHTETANIIVVNKAPNNQELKMNEVVMVCFGPKNETGIHLTKLQVTRVGQPSVLELKIHAILEAYFGLVVPLIGLEDVKVQSIPSRSIVISTLELDKPLLSTLREDEMGFVKMMTDRASLILWLCHAEFMGGMDPNFATVLGLSRAVMLEQPSLRFAVFDIDNVMTETDYTAYNTRKVLDQLLRHPDPELELCQCEQTIHCVRWEPINELNEQFRLKQEEGLEKVPIKKSGRSRLHISKPGQMDTIHFVRAEYDEPLLGDFVDIQVKSVGINAKDLYVLSAKVDTRNVSCSCECAGVVMRVGSEVTKFKPGDRVVAMAPGHFATRERLPQWALAKLEDSEDFALASTIPIVFSTAIYGLVHRASLQPGETVLIHSAAGGVGLAAIQLAKHIGAKIFATVGNESKKKFLIQEVGIDPHRIFNSRDSSFLPAILEATDGKGVDVVLNSLTGELLRSSLEACTDFGRFVEIGKRDILDHGSLNMSYFEKDLSFMAFDLSKLFYSETPGHHEIWQQLLAESLRLVRDGIAKPCFPIETFCASEITQAFRHFSLGTRMGKVTVSFEEGDECMLVRPRRFQSSFSKNRTYLMIGCLGGLGRSISKWMVSHGAKGFVFLGRTGLAKPEAKALIDDLLERGVRVEVIQGDVSIYKDVERCLERAPMPIGGVIHAAMALNEALWGSMTLNNWHSSLSPKLRGSWNIHKALEKDGRDSQLEFFILTSSISGTVGTATESNYCAANAFLDAFARYRNRLGKPAISIGYGMIAEVGYLHEHPEIEALLKRKGIHSITEDELLQILDLAIINQARSTWAPHYDSLVGAHILTGIEFIGLKEQRDRGFEGGNQVLADPRASLLAAAFERSTRGAVGGMKADYGLPAQVSKALAMGEIGTSVADIVLEAVASKISNLILLPAGQLKLDQKLGEFGIDSMLASEFRSSIFHAFNVDVPFMTILDKQTTARSLTGIIVAALESKRQLASTRQDRATGTENGGGLS